MAVMIPRYQVELHRDGKRVSPRVGEPFDFTDDEIMELQASAPGLLRPPVNESVQSRREVTSGRIRPTANTAPAAELDHEREVEVEIEADEAEARATRTRTRAAKPAVISTDEDTHL